MESFLRYTSKDMNEEKLKHKYNLALQWPQAAMLALSSQRDINVASRVHEGWTVHGLWKVPRGLPGPFPASMDEHYEPPTDLHKFWPSFSPTSTSAEFFQQEYIKHGNTHFPDKSTYLEKVKSLSENFNVFQLLRDKNIFPNGRTYLREDVMSALTRDAFGHNLFSVVLICLSPRTNLSPNYLQEVRFCLNEDFELTTCESNSWLKFNCPEQVTYLERKECPHGKKQTKVHPPHKGEVEQCNIKEIPWFVDDQDTVGWWNMAQRAKAKNQCK